ncbi:FAD-dependent monooxygenase [Winogradskya consettensis]|uniref:FAD-dependent oxidoreductase n=1 Tax=Winogradskya consettensis TaxID=113560 RepID=A0A919SDC5_9ACTN|nr:NAD(P)/FAD-dependent oxidoreductase [Actinoplanes consettensis]GIM68952.1 FAD-dependent oxidoreductase [Actinoplanes consettensis]
MTKTAIVAGGGIAGTVAALALHRAGFTPHIYEAGDAAEDGAFVTVAANGLNALRDLGLDPAELLAAGFPTPRMRLRGAKGQFLADLPLGDTTTTIRRADLYQGLRASVRAADIPITYGKRLVSAVPDGAGVRVGFKDGLEVRGELLIGADGLNSRTRKALDPAAPAPRYLGLLNAGGFTDGPVVDPPEPGVMQMAFGRRAFFGWATAPDGSVWWFANPVRREPVERGEFTATSWRNYLLDVFADDPFPARELIGATSVALGPWNTWDVPRLPVWHDDRIVLVGDAAHAVSPSSGQGASMAIEDAVVLGRCLGAERIPAALSAYERIRRPRVERVVAYGKRSGSTKAAGPIGAKVRDALTPLIMRMLHRRGNPQAWILDHRV